MTDRFGIVGLGGIGRWQTRMLQGMDGVAVVAGVDVVPDARERYEEEYGIPTFADYETMLAEADLDAAAIVTPHTLHYEQARACLDAGVHVHLEKPMVTTVVDAVDLVERAEANDLALQVGYQRHFAPAYEELKRVVASGRIGEVHMAACYLAQDWIDDQLGTWRTDPDLSGGGQLIDSGSHLLDALLWVTDARPRQVAAVQDDRDHEVDVNSALSATLEGPERTITASVGVSGDGTGFEEGLSVWGTEGHVAFRDGDLTVREAGTPSPYTAELPGEDDAHERKLEAFVAAVRGEREVAVPGEFGLRVTALTEAAFRSADSGDTVDAAALITDAREQVDAADD